MIGGSLRARLTVWYVTILAVATLSLTGASWWLSDLSVVRAADTSLQARVEGVQRFLENPDTRLTVAGLRDEFREYAELTRGEALLEVIDASGVVLCRPSVPGWRDVADAEAPPYDALGLQPGDGVLGGLPFRVASARIEAAGRPYRVTVAAPMGPALAALERFHRLLLWLVPAVLGFAGIGGYWLSRRALAPVDRITSAAQAITVESLDRRLDLPAANDELRRLAATFNEMLARLQSAVGEIVRFTADASHELRTPVALVCTTAEVSLRRDRQPEEYRRALEEVLAYGRHMSALVDDLLVLARTDAGLDAPGDETVDLGEIARDACAEVQPLADGQSIRLCRDLRDGSLIVRGDRRALWRLVRILLDNAVRYTPAGGTVRLTVSRAPDRGGAAPAALVDVSDDGIGVDPDEVPRLFERFYRGARARQHRPEGSGLGLAIARTITERHSGSIAIGAPGRTGRGHGCRVQVRLPLDRAVPAGSRDAAALAGTTTS